MLSYIGAQGERRCGCQYDSWANPQKWQENQMYHIWFDNSVVGLAIINHGLLMKSFND